jgi:hypothetical protein
MRHCGVLYLFIPLTLWDNIFKLQKVRMAWFLKYPGAIFVYFQLPTYSMAILLALWP